MLRHLPLDILGTFLSKKGRAKTCICGRLLTDPGLARDTIGSQRRERAVTAICIYMVCTARYAHVAMGEYILIQGRPGQIHGYIQQHPFEGVVSWA